jgi:RNA polymerase sigma factor (sigma-70 family)
VGRYTQSVRIECDRIFGRGTVSGESEAALLGRFITDGDESALTALVARHGPMVLGVCRRVLRDEHAVEDAFQATFLVLVRRAAAIRDGERIGGWLYGVAHRVAVRARATAARQARTNMPNPTAVPAAARTPPDDAARGELRAVVDDELARLPESLRAPLVLCYVEGLTHATCFHAHGRRHRESVAWLRIIKDGRRRHFGGGHHAG